MGRTLVWVLTPLLLILAMTLPYLPGRHDPLATTLSAMVQVCVVAGALLFVPIGSLWYWHVRGFRVRRAQGLPAQNRSGAFGVATIAAGGILVALAALVAFAYGQSAFAAIFVVAAVGVLVALGVTLRTARFFGADGTIGMPLFLMVVPLIGLTAMLALTRPLTNYSRVRAITNAAPLIEQIEAFAIAYGEYPSTLVGLHPDITPEVRGIERYQYTRLGDAYNLAFEQPRLLFDDIGAREVVVYNPADAHVFLSHALWNLEWMPEVAARNQGWFAARETGHAHWKSLLFD